MNRETKRCEAKITFSNDQFQTRCSFQCELPEGHRGLHQASGISYNVKFTITWEEFALEKNFIPSGIQLGMA